MIDPGENRDEFFFDFQAGYLRQQQLKLVKKLHCWEVAVELSQNQQRNSDAERELNYTAMVTFTLLGMQNPIQKINISFYNYFELGKGRRNARFRYEFY